MYAVFEAQVPEPGASPIGTATTTIQPPVAVDATDIDAFLDRIERAGRAGVLPLDVSRNARRRWQESPDLDAWVAWFTASCGTTSPSELIYCDECGADLVDPEKWRGRATVRCGFCQARWQIIVRDPAWWSCDLIEGGRYAPLTNPPVAPTPRPDGRPPPNFDEEWMTEWSLWVLENGLPDLPDRVATGESVPVAYWAGPRFGAVLHVKWSWSRHHRNDQLQSEIEPFRRVANQWESSGAGGGTGWYDPPLARLDLGPREAFTGGTFTQSHLGDRGKGICIIDGVAGTDAAFVEIGTDVGVVRRRLDSPLGVFVAATNLGRAASLRVLDAEGQTLLEQPFGSSS